jgi:hypothetical protein
MRRESEVDRALTIGIDLSNDEITAGIGVEFKHRDRGAGMHEWIIALSTLNALSVAISSCKRKKQERSTRFALRSCTYCTSVHADCNSACQAYLQFPLEKKVLGLGLDVPTFGEFGLKDFTFGAKSVEFGHNGARGPTELITDELDEVFGFERVIVILDN